MSEEAKQAAAIPPGSTPQKEWDFVEPADGIFRTYANHHQLGWTGYDVRILFGELVEVTGDKLVIEQSAHVTMSWPQAKLLLLSLQNLIGQFEKLNGTIEPKEVPQAF